MLTHREMSIGFDGNLDFGECYNTGRHISLCLPGHRMLFTFNMAEHFGIGTTINTFERSIIRISVAHTALGVFLLPSCPFIKLTVRLAAGSAIPRS